MRYASQETGHYVEPTIFFNLKDDACIYHEGIFGLVSTIGTFRIEEEP